MLPGKVWFVVALGFVLSAYVLAADAHGLFDGLSYAELIEGFQAPEWWRLWCFDRTDCVT